MILKMNLSTTQFASLATFIVSEQNIVYHPSNVTKKRSFARIIVAKTGTTKMDGATEKDMQVVLEIAEFHRSRLDEMYDPIPMSFLKDLMKAIGKYQTKREDESGFRKQ